MHVLIGLPTPQVSDVDFSLGNLPEIVSYTKSVIPDIKITVAHKTGVRTDSNRNHILDQAIQDGTVDYILWLDTDMIYPKQILERYLVDTKKNNIGVDVIGCLYFKRSYPYDVVGYDKGETEAYPYKPVLPTLIQPGKIYEVEGVGYGGMLVNMKVYEKIGEKKWTKYGDNFHIPTAGLKNKLTHDLQFCKDVKEAGLSVKIHGSVKPGHIGAHVVTQDDWERAIRENFEFKAYPKVTVIIPATNEEQAQKTAQVMMKRAGVPCGVLVCMDNNRQGFIKTVNEQVKELKPEVVVYAAQDALPAQDWLREALKEMLITSSGLHAFNDGKWNGSLASFGMARYAWFKDLYDGNLFHPGYNSHYADTELTQIAKQQGMYSYSKNAILLEVDYDKALGKGKGLNTADKNLYKQRKQKQFDGLVTDEDLLQEFS